MRRSIFLLVFISTMAMAQNPTKADIVGRYSLPNSNPEGGQSVVVFENNTFATFYFGGALKGTWKIEGNTVNFKTESYPKFYLYGRILNSLKDRTHLNFGFEAYNFINLKSKTSDIFQPMFNEDANCFGYPYFYKSDTPLAQVAFATKDHSYDNDNYHVYTFEVSEAYNDLIVVGLPEEYTTEVKFSALYKEGDLYFSGNKPAHKSPFSMDKNTENQTYLEKFMNEEIVPEILTYGNEFFPNYEDPNEEQLIPYTRIEPVKKEIEKIKIGKNNLFTARCED